MFLEFFFTLRANKVPVSTTEYLDLLKVIDQLTQEFQIITPERFYIIARSCLIKDLKYYDIFDLCYSQIFSGLIQQDGAFKEMLEKWLNEAKKKDLSNEQKQQAMLLPPEELLKQLEKRLQEQKERHDGGNYWIGTGGTSAFGHSGYNPQGIRIGGHGNSKSALIVAGERRYRSYRTDEVFSTRQTKMALKSLRSFAKKGRAEISIKKSIQETCQQAGEITLVEEKTRKNNLKVLLLMDVGGSMDIHARGVEELFSALHQVNHFKQFQSLYFHNVFYDHLYDKADLTFENSHEIEKIYQRFDSQTRVIILGDAYMAPYELFSINGEMRNYYDYFGRVRYQYNQGHSPIAIDRLREFYSNYPQTVWLNPQIEDLWGEPTIKAIREIFPMFTLTLDGLKQCVNHLT